MERLNPGKLRHQITWQRDAIAGQNSTGEDIVTLFNVVTCKAEIVSLRGNELAAAEQIWSEAKYQITQHYYRGLDTSMRISWYNDGRVQTLDVLDIQDPIGAGRFQIIIAKDH